MGKLYLERRWDGSVESPTVSMLKDALRELDTADEEHPDTWLSDEDGWTISVTETGTVTLSGPPANEGPWHMERVSREAALALWLQLRAGQIEKIRRQPWIPGERPVPAEERQRSRTKAEAALHALDVQFMDTLGPERPELPCREAGCDRGSVQYSVMCRIHHFAMVRGRPWSGAPR